MAKVQTTYCIVGFILTPLILLVAGCAQNTDGMRIFEDLRADGLLHDIGDDPALQYQGTETPVSWSFPVEGELSLSRLLEAADQLNPRIAAARAQIGIAGGRTWQASLYPNPSLDLESGNVRPSGGGFGVSETTVGITQPIIISGRREAAVAAGRARMSVERWELERVRRQVHGQIRREVTEVVHYRQAISLHRELRSLAQRTLDVSQTRFEARAAPESEAIRARIEFNSLGLAIERLRGDMAAAGEKLDTLLGGHHIDLHRVESDILEIAPSLQLTTLDELIATVRTTHPAVLAAEANVEAAKRQVDLERALRYPDITARFGVGVNHMDDEGFVEAGVSIPLPLSDQNQGDILAARFGVIHARQESAAISNELAGSLAEAYRRWESAAARLAVFEEQILAGAQRSYDQTSAGYEAGKLPFLDLLDAQRTLIEANVAEIELRRSVSLTRSEIYEILGECPEPEYHQGDLP